MATFDNSSTDASSDTTVSLVIYEWEDEYLLGAASSQSDGAVLAP